MTRDELVEKIRWTKERIKTAGPVHKRDLRKHLHHMENDLRQYDAFHAAAKERVG